MTFRKLCSDLDSYIYKYRAQHNPPVDPPSLRLSLEQKTCAVEWGTRHPDRPILHVRDGKVIHYKGITVSQ